MPLFRLFFILLFHYFAIIFCRHYFDAAIIVAIAFIFDSCRYFRQAYFDY